MPYTKEGSNMTQPNIDELIRAYSRLKAIKAHLPTFSSIREKYALEYHEVVDKLEKQGYRLSEFRVPEKEIKQKVASSNFMTGEVKYSKDKCIDRAYLLMKLDSLLSYFEIYIEQANTPDRKIIGFKVEQ